MALEPSSMHPHTSSTSSEDPATSPRSTSLAAAATINAGNQAQEGRHGSVGSARNPGSPALRRTLTGERRRSNVAMNLSLNDPAMPAPGELQTAGENRPPSRTFRTSSPQTINRSPSLTDPQHHHRAPSIGELHQELEQEQEAQVVSSGVSVPRFPPFHAFLNIPSAHFRPVTLRMLQLTLRPRYQNRLLQTIRIQQSQIAALQAQTGTPAPTGSPTSERSLSFSTTNNNPVGTTTNHIRTRSRRPSQVSPTPPRGIPSGTAPSHHIPIADESAIASSGTATPMTGAGGTGNFGTASGPIGSARDETAFYQAEAQALTRENQLLKTRIKELERQIAQHAGGSGGHSHGQRVVPDGAMDGIEESKA